jgi:hypothetical protein
MLSQLPSSSPPPSSPPPPSSSSSSSSSPPSSSSSQQVTSVSHGLLPCWSVGYIPSHTLRIMMTAIAGIALSVAASAVQTLKIKPSESFNHNDLYAVLYPCSLWSRAHVTLAPEGIISYSCSGLCHSTGFARLPPTLLGPSPLSLLYS